MQKYTGAIKQLPVFLLSLASPVAAVAGGHTEGAPQVALAEVDPYVHRSNFIVRDLDRAFRVYRDILGFKVDAIATASAFMDDVLNIPPEAETRIAFLSSVEGEFGNIGMTEIKGVDLPLATGIHPSVLIVEVQRDMQDLSDRLKAEGCQVERIYELSNPARTEIVFTDLDGHRVILMKLRVPEQAETSSGAAAAPTPVAASHETEALGDGLYAFRMGVGRSFFLVGEQGVIVIDPLNTAAAGILQTEIAGITDQPVTHVAYSNSLFERSAGGQIFKDGGARFVAQKKCADNLRETPRPDVVMPDTVFDESYELAVGNQVLELHYLGPSYGDCFTVMIARPANIMLLTDIVSPPAARLPDDPTLANYSLHTMIAFFDAVEDLAHKSAVESVAGGRVSFGQDQAGRAVVLPGTAPVSLIAEQRAVWETLLGSVKAEYDRGTPARMIPQKIDLGQFSGYAGYDEKKLRIMPRRIYSLYRIGR
jgi:catechol 2,3-dioxygenase-like lactoylglutathione lyase family enzyme